MLELAAARSRDLSSRWSTFIESAAESFGYDKLPYFSVRTVKNSFLNVSPSELKPIYESLSGHTMFLLDKSRIFVSSVGRRSIYSTCRLNFKFKLTDEMVKEHYEREAVKEKEPPPERALHTREGSLIMGRVSHERYGRVVRIGVPKHRLNEHLVLFVRENDNVQAYDENLDCKPGDWVLLRRQKDPIDKDVEHKVERIIYSYGNYIDPLTGRRALGLIHDDDMKRLEDIKIEV